MGVIAFPCPGFNQFQVVKIQKMVHGLQSWLTNASQWFTSNSVTTCHFQQVPWKTACSVSHSYPNSCINKLSRYTISTDLSNWWEYSQPKTRWLISINRIVTVMVSEHGVFPLRNAIKHKSVIKGFGFIKPRDMDIEFPCSPLLSILCHKYSSSSIVNPGIRTSCSNSNKYH